MEMTGAELMAVVVFGVTLFGAGFGLWRYWEGKIAANTARTEKNASDLANHKLHVAENYITKVGMRESVESIMEAIHGVRTAVDGMTSRVDRIVEGQHQTLRSRHNTQD